LPQCLAGPAYPPQRPYPDPIQHELDPQYSTLNKFGQTISDGLGNLLPHKECMKKAIFKSIFKIQSLTRNVFLTVAADLQALLVVLQADVRAELLDIRPEPGEFSRKRD
jgi:hypothetical protein